MFRNRAVIERVVRLEKINYFNEKKTGKINEKKRKN